MTHWTEQQLIDHLSRHAAPEPLGMVDVSAPPFKLPNNPAGRYALGRLPTGTMNKTEAAYDAHLWQMRHEGIVLWHKFEAVKLRLADNTFYTPDFAVLPDDGIFELREVKGHWEDDARVKIKVAASLYPFRFIAVTAKSKRNGGGWEVERF